MKKSICVSSFSKPVMTLTKQMKELAEWYALGCIDMPTVENALSIKKECLPKSFFKYADNYYKEYRINTLLNEERRISDALERASKWGLEMQVLYAIEDGLSPEQACNIYHI